MTNEGKDPATEVRSPKRWLIGEPLASEKLEGQLLPKHLALPIFASDALSSVAYAPQELMMILLVGGVSFLTLSPWVAVAVIVLLLTVVASYRQLVKAYPSGGGDYEVAHKNLGEKAGLIVASALLVDYVMTVAVSVASGVDNIISALPVLSGVRVELAVGFVVLIAGANLRGVREASKAFAIPTYVFIGSIVFMIGTALVRTAFGDAPVAESAQYLVHSEGLTQAAMVLLLLRAFSSGCSALTGVEAVANGVPAFRTPKVKNARRTLLLMGGIAVTLFAGLMATALIAQVHYAEHPCDLVGWTQCATQPQRSLIAQLASATFGDNTVLFFIVQAATAIVLLLAANTAFNGFPLLGSVLAKDSYAPKALSTRGDRLVFSNGVIALALAAIILLVIYRANLTNLIQLYIIGVFVSFTLGQSGMVRHWVRLLKGGASDRVGIIRSLCINAFGAMLTFSVLVVVTITKFTHGAWLVFIMMPILFTLMLGVNRYYRDVEKEVEVDPTTKFGSRGDHAIVLVGKMQKPALKALDYAIAARHDSIEAVNIEIDEESSSRLQEQWKEMNIHVPLTLIESPYRDLGVPLAKYIKQRREKHGAEVVTVYLPQYIVGHWWESLLHNHRARRVARQVMLVHGVTVALVPWLLDSSELIYGRRSRPLPGQDRRGEPVRPKRPVARKPLQPASAAPPAPAPATAPAPRKRRK
ncbi:APC family permease [Microbacterium sp. STN6]|uniref:APC family permease n=1 Tax=Microbacterium sp. STN6 TaxID=2995588 RepID=UPI0022609AFF|nr:APC family permease [Microbacterium sp. STN6]MCX7522984.1 APC family permease [Microbacterium sp. STN6]